MNIFKLISSSILSFMLVFSTMPTQVFAARGGAVSTQVQPVSFSSERTQQMVTLANGSRMLASDFEKLSSTVQCHFLYGVASSICDVKPFVEFSFTNEHEGFIDGASFFEEPDDITRVAPPLVDPDFEGPIGAGSEPSEDEVVYIKFNESQSMTASMSAPSESSVTSSFSVSHDANVEDDFSTEGLTLSETGGFDGNLEAADRLEQTPTETTNPGVPNYIWIAVEDIVEEAELVPMMFDSGIEVAARFRATGKAVQMLTAIQAAINNGSPGSDREIESVDGGVSANQQMLGSENLSDSQESLEMNTSPNNVQAIPEETGITELVYRVPESQLNCSDDPGAWDVTDPNYGNNCATQPAPAPARNLSGELQAPHSVLGVIDMYAMGAMDNNEGLAEDRVTIVTMDGEISEQGLEYNGELFVNTNEINAAELANIMQLNNLTNVNQIKSKHLINVYGSLTQALTALSDGVDDDPFLDINGNIIYDDNQNPVGLVDDIIGYDFVNMDNNIFGTGTSITHGTGVVSAAVAKTDNGLGSSSLSTNTVALHLVVADSNNQVNSDSVYLESSFYVAALMNRGVVKDTILTFTTNPLITPLLGVAGNMFYSHAFMNGNVGLMVAPIGNQGITFTTDDWTQFVYFVENIRVLTANSFIETPNGLVMAPGNNKGRPMHNWGLAALDKILVSDGTPMGHHMLSGTSFSAVQIASLVAQIIYDGRQYAKTKSPATQDAFTVYPVVFSTLAGSAEKLADHGIFDFDKTTAFGQMELGYGPVHGATSVQQLHDYLDSYEINQAIAPEQVVTTSIGARSLSQDVLTLKIAFYNLYNTLEGMIPGNSINIPLTLTLDYPFGSTIIGESAFPDFPAFSNYVDVQVFTATDLAMYGLDPNIVGWPAGVTFSVNKPNSAAGMAPEINNNNNEVSGPINTIP